MYMQTNNKLCNSSFSKVRELQRDTDGQTDATVNITMAGTFTGNNQTNMPSTQSTDD